ncbi:MAG: ABC transporter permease [Desulfobacterales bacterium]|jgi:simple sugar transport system permease protein
MLSIRAYKRQEPLKWRSCLVFLGAVLLSLAASALLLQVHGKPALDGIRILFTGAFGSLWALEDCLIKAIPIFLCSLGVAIAFRLQVWNIGAEGQFALGAIGATWAALTFPHLPGYWLLPLMAAAAFVLGGLWGLIPALLKLRMQANEIIVTLMMNYIAILILDYLVYGHWKDPQSFGFPMTPEFSPGAIVGKIGSTNLNWGLVVCLLTGVVVWVFFRFTRLGFEFRAAGENIRASRYAGLPYQRLVCLAMVLSGALAGWAGLLEASATINRLQPSIMVGYGYTAIVVAWLARLNPLTIGLASFLLAALRVGVENLQLDLQVPAAFGGIMEGLILLTVLAGSFFLEYGLKLRRTA